MDRDGSILLSRLGGETLTAIGGRFNLTAEAVRLAVIRESRRWIDKLVLAAWACQKTGGLLTLGVPAWAPADLAAEYLTWVVGELQKRDDGRWVCHYRPGLDGSHAFLIEDVSFIPSEEDQR